MLWVRMKTVGILHIENTGDVAKFREKVQLTSRALLFSHKEANEIANLASALTADLLKANARITSSFLVQGSTENCLHLELQYSSSPKTLDTNDQKTFFDQFEKLTPPNALVLRMSKKLPGEASNLPADHLNTVRANFHHFPSQELLRPIDTSQLRMTNGMSELGESQLELLIRSQKLAKVGGWAINAHDLSLTWTEEVYHMLEVSPHIKPKLQDAINFYAPEAVPVISQAVNEALSQGIPWDLVLPCITARGNNRWVRAIGFPEMKLGKVVRVVGIFQDITADKITELEIARKNQELELKNKALQEFAYISSHDLQEPLRTISSFSQLLSEDYSHQLDETGKKSLDYIVEASDRMSRLIKELLSYSSIGRESQKVTVDCNEILHEVRDDLSPLLSETQAVLDVEELPTVFGSPLGLKQLFQNIISNAIKFRKPDLAPLITVSAQKKDGFWQFSIRDNGIGISKIHQSKVFDIFKRLHTRDEYEGTGIGLAICQKIVKLHEGSIWVESEPGAGSNFYFTLKND